MPRDKTAEEEVTLAEAAKRLAMTAQGVGQWADKAPGEWVRVKKTRRVLIWPGFMIWYRQRLQEASREKPADLADAQKRKLSAEAEMAEMERDTMRGELVAVSEVRTQMRGIASTIRMQLLAVSGRYAARTVGLTTLPESQRVWDTAMRDILAELQEG